MRFSSASASDRTTPFSSLVLLSIVLGAPVLHSFPVQAQAAATEGIEQPDAPSIPLAIPDDIVIQPARRPIEQPAKPINSVEEVARQADEKREATAREAWQQAFAAAGGDAAEKASPDKTAQAYGAFLKSHPDLHPAVAVDASIRLAHLQERNLQQPEAALATLQEAWQSNKKHPSALSVLGEQAKLMARQGKGTEAGALVKPYVERALLGLESGSPSSSVAGGRTLLQGLVAALRVQGKGAKEAVPVVLRVLREQPRYLSAGAQGDGGWMYREAVESLIEGKQEPEALRWAKLCFVESGFEAAPLSSASALVAKALGAADASGASLEQWAKAQQDAQVPNPLRDVKLPLLNVDEARSKLGDMGRGHDNASDRIGLLLWLGDGRGAMEEARHMLDGLGKGEARARASEPVLEACRVLKARDLNLKGGNAYLQWLRDKQGTDPVEAFLSKAAPAATSAAGEEG